MLGAATRQFPSAEHAHSELKNERVRRVAEFNVEAFEFLQEPSACRKAAEHGSILAKLRVISLEVEPSLSFLGRVLQEKG